MSKQMRSRAGSLLSFMESGGWPSQRVGQPIMPPPGIVDQSAESVTSSYLWWRCDGDGGEGLRMIGPKQVERTVRTMVVVMGNIDAKYPLKMTRGYNQHPVQALTPQGCPRSAPHGRSLAGIEWVCGSLECPRFGTPLVEGSVNLASRSLIRSRRPASRCPIDITRLRACWVTQAPVGVVVIPAR